MLKIENVEVCGWEHAIRGMRNPMNSWDRMDSKHCYENADCDLCIYNRDYVYEDENEPFKFECAYSIENNFGDPYVIGPNDRELMMRLAAGGSVHAKYRRMIVVYLDVTAPLYWWKEADTYKIGTVANSCSTMHKIHAKEFTMDDFSHEHLTTDEWISIRTYTPFEMLESIIKDLNYIRDSYNQTKDKKYWYHMIQLLPTSYNQKRTLMLNYEVLHNIYISRKDHKLDEWRYFCDWINTLPYSEIITENKKEIETE